MWGKVGIQLVFKIRRSKKKVIEKYINIPFAYWRAKC